MPRKPKEKQVYEMTSEELARKAFHPAVLEKLQQIVRENDEPKPRKSSPTKDK